MTYDSTCFKCIAHGLGSRRTGSHRSHPSGHHHGAGGVTARASPANYFGGRAITNAAVKEFKLEILRSSSTRNMITGTLV